MDIGYGAMRMDDSIFVGLTFCFLVGGCDSHFLMTFDTSPIMLRKIDESLKRDPAVIRYVTS